MRPTTNLRLNTARPVLAERWLRAAGRGRTWCVASSFFDRVTKVPAVQRDIGRFEVVGCPMLGRPTSGSSPFFAVRVKTTSDMNERQLLGLREAVSNDWNWGA